MGSKKWPVCSTLTEVEQLGAFANAFRASESADGGIFLDFLLYSPTEQRATVVTRIRAEPGFLQKCHERLDEILLDLTFSSGVSREDLH